MSWRHPRAKAQCSLASTPNAVPHRRVAFSSIASNTGHEIAPGRSVLPHAPARSGSHSASCRRRSARISRGAVKVLSVHAPAFIGRSLPIIVDWGKGRRSSGRLWRSCRTSTVKPASNGTSPAARTRLRPVYSRCLLILRFRTTSQRLRLSPWRAHPRT